jgi:hypothetical protein
MAYFLLSGYLPRSSGPAYGWTINIRKRYAYQKPVYEFTQNERRQKGIKHIPTPENFHTKTGSEDVYQSILLGYGLPITLLEPFQNVHFAASWKRKYSDKIFFST